MTRAQDLPGRPSRSTWLFVLAVLLLCAVAVTPLLRADNPCSHDGAFHYYRVVAMRHALGNGILFTRYLPDLAFGYGYPFFNYRAALSYYAALALHLTGLALPISLNLVYVLSIAGSALFAYLLARDLFGPQAGIVAAIAYAYAPYQFLNALLRANAPESVALPLLPLILWAFRRLALEGQRRWFLLSVGSLAALVLSHNISSLLFVPFLVLYLLILWLVYRKGFHGVVVGGALALGMGLTAFFWAPALMEQDYVQLHMSHITRNNDFHYNFLTLTEIFAPPEAVDTSLMNPPMRIHLGLVQTILAVLGFTIGLIRLRDPEIRATLIFLASVTLAMLGMSTRASLWAWEHIPLLPFVQFPWRLIGRAILPVSLLAGALVPAAATLGRLKPPPTLTISYVTAFISVALIILSAFPFTYPPQGYCVNAPYPTIVDVFAYERQSKLVGVDPEGSYFPVWVKQRPKTGSPLEQQYETGGTVARFDETTLPTGAKIVEATYSPNKADLVIDTPAGFRARYMAFYFPGWQVKIDGESVDVGATDPEGLITFGVPAGIHTISVRFGSTTLRAVVSLISLLTFAALSVLLLRYPPVSQSASRHIMESADHPSVTERWALPIACCLLAIVLLGLKLSVVDKVDTVFRRPTLRADGTLASVEYAMSQEYDDGMSLIGYDRDHATIAADSELGIDLYWTRRNQPSAHYQTVIHLVGPERIRWSLPDTARPRGYADYPPNYSWAPDHYAIDSHQVMPLPATPPGTYDIVLTTFDRETLAPLSVLDEQGQPTAPELILGQVTLVAPTQPPELASLGIRRPLEIPLGPLTLLGADFDRMEAAPGDLVFLTTFWRVDQQPQRDVDLGTAISLLASNGVPVAEFERPPTADWHATSTWTSGEVWRGQHHLRLPAYLEDGEYAWHLTLEPVANVPNGQASTDLASVIHISAPSHSFVAPPVDIQVNTRLGDVATLMGAQVESNTSDLSAGSPVTVTLVWRVEKTPSVSFHVFLHLLDPDGNLVAQSDGIPAEWSRPTTGWLPGEYISDAHMLTIPSNTRPGNYHLAVGLYTPGDARLTTPDGSTAISLTTITVSSR
jgi:hypothetical protein